MNSALSSPHRTSMPIPSGDMLHNKPDIKSNRWSGFLITVTCQEAPVQLGVSRCIPHRQTLQAKLPHAPGCRTVSSPLRPSPSFPAAADHIPNQSPAAHAGRCSSPAARGRHGVRDHIVCRMECPLPEGPQGCAVPNARLAAEAAEHINFHIGFPRPSLSSLSVHVTSAHLRLHTVKADRDAVVGRGGEHIRPRHPRCVLRQRARVDRHVLVGVRDVAARPATAEVTGGASAGAAERACALRYDTSAAADEIQVSCKPWKALHM